jgi:hypothetical protein
MAGATVNVRSMAIVLGIVFLSLLGLYYIDPSLGGLLRSKEGFYEGDASAPTLSTMVNSSADPTMNQAGGAETTALVEGAPSAMGGDKKKKDEGFSDLSETAGPADFSETTGPAGCYPRDQLTPSELLPKDGSSTWAQQNPMGVGSLKGKNFLSAGALIGVNTVGQSMRNANLQLRSEPPNPQVSVTVFNNSTIEPDINRRDLEIN